MGIRPEKKRIDFLLLLLVSGLREREFISNDWQREKNYLFLRGQEFLESESVRGFWYFCKLWEIPGDTVCTSPNILEWTGLSVRIF